ncbi:hypothetical protein ACJX0J_024278, partial [Zea mays]
FLKVDTKWFYFLWNFASKDKCLCYLEANQTFALILSSSCAAVKKVFFYYYYYYYYYYYLSDIVAWILPQQLFHG